MYKQKKIWFNKYLLKLTARNVTPPFKTQKMQLNEYGTRDEFNLEIYNPLIDRITHIWNKNQNLVPYETLVAAKESKKKKFDEVQDYTVKRVKYIVATRLGEPYFMYRWVRDNMETLNFLVKRNC